MITSVPPNELVSVTLPLPSTSATVLVSVSLDIETIAGVPIPSLPPSSATWLPSFGSESGSTPVITLPNVAVPPSTTISVSSFAVGPVSLIRIERVAESVRPAPFSIV